MKTKTNKTKVVRTVKSREKSYPAYYLALLLSAVLLLEGFLMGAATQEDWQESLRILDVSQGFEIVMSDTYFAIEPMLEQVHSVEIFFQLAATETIVLLDTSYVDVLAFPKAVFGFYDAASIELASMLDFSNEFAYFPRVASASISR